MHAWTGWVVVVGIAAWHNALHLAPRRWRDLVVSVGAALAAGIGAWWLFGSTDPAVGLAVAVPWTLAALALTATVVVAMRSTPRLRDRLADVRMASMSTTTFMVHVLLRIPVLTALVEEVLFRGVAWRLLASSGGEVVAWLGTSMAFGVGHVAVALDQARREGHPLATWVAVTILATTTAGLALGGLRGATGGIWAPVGVHAVVNATLAWGARSVADTPVEP